MTLEPARIRLWHKLKPAGNSPFGWNRFLASTYCRFPSDRIPARLTASPFSWAGLRSDESFVASDENSGHVPGLVGRPCGAPSPLWPGVGYVRVGWRF